MNDRRWVLAATMMMTMMAPLPAAAAPSVAQQQQWETLRARYPYHAQLVAVSDPDDDGTRTLIVTEPPPHVTVEALRRMIPAAITMQKQLIGYDGYAVDAVAALPPMSQDAVNEIVAQLHLAMFGTTYKAFAVRLPAMPDQGTHEDTLDLSIGPYDLDRLLAAAAVESRGGSFWLLSLAAVGLALILSVRLIRRPSAGAAVLLALVVAGGVYIPSMSAASPGQERRFVRVDRGGEALTVKQLAAQQATGVFRSETPGLIIWATGRTLTAVDRAAIRMFALDSDLIVGGVAMGDRLFVVARERAVSIDRLPPLRAETVLLLAGVGTDDLAQSYERNTLLSGRFTKDDDWAPIYLSDVLIDSEYGSLLNITDQILKSWSNCGQTTYTRFDYPPPAHGYPLDSPLSALAVGKAVTYNWNTKGAGYVSVRDGIAIYALARTGALPVDYLGKSDAKLSSYEDTAYGRFATSGDPNLVRVVQYAALFQMFRHFQVTAPPPPTPARRAVDSGPMRHLVGLIVATTAAQVHRAEAEAEAAPPGFRADAAHARLAGRRAMAAVGQVLRAKAGTSAGAALRERFVAELADPAALRAAQQEIRNRAFEDETPAAQAALLIHQLEPLTDLAEDPEVVDRARRDYVRSVTRTSDTWIRTPTIVVSQARDDAPDGFIAVGGHDLDATVTHFLLDPAVSRGTVRIAEEDGQRIVHLHPDDLAQEGALVRQAGKGSGKNLQELQEELTGLVRPGARSSGPAQALLALPEGYATRTTRGLDLANDEARALVTGWSLRPGPLTTEQNALVKAWADVGARPVIVDRVPDGYVIYNQATGEVIQARTIAAALETVERIYSPSASSVAGHVHMRNVPLDSARGFAASAELRGLTKVMVTSEPHAVAPAQMAEQLGHQLQWKLTQIEEVTVADRTLSVALTVPDTAGRIARRVNVQALFESAAHITAEVRVRVQEILTHWIGLLQNVHDTVVYMQMIRQLNRDLERVAPGLSVSTRLTHEVGDLFISDSEPLPVMGEVLGE